MQQQSGLRQRFGAGRIERERAALGSEGVGMARKPRQRHAQIIEGLPVVRAEPGGVLIGVGGARRIAFLE